ncbi:MAG: NTP transferase domain-containing protein [Muribaculaceae bacterium]|nr:NTP transferase domain-containing protein [Muribaculaceae bacterium]
MKALVFAAGLGTRLGEYTRNHPKALVEVGGAPMLLHVLRRLKDAGVDEVVVNVHHFAEQIIDFLSGVSDELGMTVKVSHERELLLETGGGILEAVRLLQPDGPFIIHNADILTDFNLTTMAEAFGTKSLHGATLLVGSRSTSRYLLLDDEMRMRGWTNVTTGQLRPAGLPSADGLLRRAFGGVHIFSPQLLPALQAYNDEKVASGAECNSGGICRFSIMDFYIDTCRDAAIYGYEPAEQYSWFDIGKPETLALAEKFYKKH